MKKGILVVFLLLVAGCIAWWIWFRPEPRQPDIYYDFYSRFDEAEIEDRGFLDLCWKEPLSGGWNQDSTEDGRQKWSRELQMPLQWDPQMLQVYVGEKPWTKRFSSKDPGSATWSVQFGQDFSKTYRFVASESCWAATQYRLEFGTATLWMDVLSNDPKLTGLKIKVVANDHPAHEVTLGSEPTRHFEWPINVLEEAIHFRFIPDRLDFNPDNVILKAGITFPCSITVDLPDKQARKLDLSDLILYYQPKNFDGLQPSRKWLAPPPKKWARSSRWMETDVVIDDINRLAFRLLPGQKISFPVWMQGDSNLRLAWADGLSRPLPQACTAQLELSIVPVSDASPSRILLNESLEETPWSPPKTWKEKTIPLDRWTKVPAHLEVEFKAGRPALEDYFSQTFAYVALSPISTTYFMDLTRPSVILFGSDTLRVDRVSCYGYRPKVNPNIRITPNVDALAAISTRYELAYSPSSFTLPVFASMFTSRYPTEHTAYVQSQPLPSSLVTLAEILQKQGYQTAAFVDKGFMDPAYGMNQGFEYYDNKDGKLKEIGPRAIDWLDSRDRNRPFFLFVHYYDTHAPYNSPKEIRQKFDPNPGYNRLPQIVEEVHPFWLKYFREHQTPLTDEDYEHISALYDASVNYMDSNLGRFLGAVDQRKLLPRTMVVFASDHGECLGERGQLAHGGTLNEQLVRVPMLIKWPGPIQRGNLVRSPVSLLDIAPTILDAAGITIPSGWQGVSLLPKPDKILDPNRILFAQLPNENEYMVLQFPYKLLLDKTGSGLKSRLYHVLNDPMEVHDLSPSEKEKSDNLLQWVTQHLADTPSVISLVQQMELNADILDNLRDLGYLGGEKSRETKTDDNK